MGNEIARPTATDGYVRVLESDFETAAKKFEAQATEINRLTSALAQAKEEALNKTRVLEAASMLPRTSSLSLPPSPSEGLSRSHSLGSKSFTMPYEQTKQSDEHTVWARKSVLQHARRGAMYPKRSTQNSGPDTELARRASLTAAFTSFIDDHAASPETAQSTVPITVVVRIFASEGTTVTLDEIRTQLIKLGITREDLLSMDEFILLYDQLRVAVAEREVDALCRIRAECLTREPTGDPESDTLIFLGGACNPTTWRRDLAIPAFKAAGLSDTAYYNPQVDHWSSELILIEAAAKRDADILLFVITDKTRAIGSMIEVAEHATLAKVSGKRVVVVIQDIKPGSSFGDTATTPAEIKDLNRGRAYLADVCARQGFVVFQTVESGIEHTIRLYGDVERRREVVANAVREASEFESGWPDAESNQGVPVSRAPLERFGSVPIITSQSEDGAVTPAVVLPASLGSSAVRSES